MLLLEPYDGTSNWFAFFDVIHVICMIFMIFYIPIEVCFDAKFARHT